MIRRRALAALALIAGVGVAHAEPSAPSLSLLLATSDDPSDVTWLPAKRGPFRVSAPTPGLELLTSGSTPGSAPTVAAVGKSLQQLGVRAARPGHFDLDLGGLTLAVDAVEVLVLESDGTRVDPKRSHASFSRTLPSELGGLPGPDRDAVSFSFVAPPGVALDTVELVSRGAAGRPIDVLAKLRAAPSVCPEGTPPELICRRTAEIRVVGDVLDRGHPVARDRSIRGEVGGNLELGSAGRRLLELPIGGPRHTRVGSIERLRAKLRVLVLRAKAGGLPAVGGDDAGAKRVMTRELGTVSAIWAQCGVELGPAEAIDVEIVAPPSTRLLNIGCGFGQVASGGSLQIMQGRTRIELSTRAGEHPSSVAGRLASALERARIPVSVFENQRTAGAMFGTTDLLLGGAPGVVEASSSDPTLPICLGHVDLSDGLKHFADGDAFSGTLEERTLLRAFDDGDPRTIEVLVVPSFARSERIGESFISSRGSSLSNSVIIDRSAIEAGARSFALAHELGHVLLSMPGHPDDFGVDQSWSLMDADVADPSVFGPRRLSVADCERAVTQTGPDGLVPLLERIPLRPPPSRVPK